MKEIVGKTFKGIIDRPIDSRHPRHEDMVYPVNYGYVKGMIAVYHRFNDNEDKWIVSLNDSDYSDDEILRTIHFQKQFFYGELVRSMSACRTVLLGMCSVTT